MYRSVRSLSTPPCPPFGLNTHVCHHPTPPYSLAFISTYFRVHAPRHVETMGRPIRASKRNRRFLRPEIVGKHTHTTAPLLYIFLRVIHRWIHLPVGVISRDSWPPTVPCVHTVVLPKPVVLPCSKLSFFGRTTV